MLLWGQVLDEKSYFQNPEKSFAADATDIIEDHHVSVRDLAAAHGIFV